MEEVKVIELPEKSSIEPTDYVVAEDLDGTKKVLVKHMRSLLVTSLYLNSVDELKNSTAVSLKEGDICETLGYYKPGDGGGAKYHIVYDPAAMEDGHLVHYLSYSDTLRAKLMQTDTINVNQFGAAGDGVTDDSDAIQAAIDNSDGRVVVFSNDRKYLIKKPIIINKPNLVIIGNGAYIVPYYTTGFRIESDDNISISNLHFDCENAVEAIRLDNVSKVDIKGCKIENVKSFGISVKASEFINILGCEFSGSQVSDSLLLLDADNEYNRFINVTECKFNEFKKAINIISNGSKAVSKIDTIINIDNCNYHSKVLNSYCIYVVAPIESMSINANNITSADTFLYFGSVSEGDISCRDISCLNTNKVFDIVTSKGILHLDGSIKASDKTIVFENMSGKLHSNVSWELSPNGALFNNKPLGQIHDTVYPYNYSNKNGYSVSGSSLVLKEARNLNIDWSSSINNIITIENGIEGQMLYIKSSTEKSIVASNNIILSDTTIKLGEYKGIILKYENMKWVQIQYEDSTILQTVNEVLLDIDYEKKIAFDTKQIF